MSDHAVNYRIRNFIGNQEQMEDVRDVTDLAVELLQTPIIYRIVHETRTMGTYYLERDPTDPNRVITTRIPPG